MSGNVLGTATIQIVPDVSRFSSELKTKVELALNGTESAWKTAFEGMENAVRELTMVIHDQMAEIRDVVSRTAADIASEFNTAGESAETSFQGSGEAIELAIHELTRVIESDLMKVRATIELTSDNLAQEMNSGAERAEQAITESGEAMEAAIREVGAQAERTGRNIASSFRNAGSSSRGSMDGAIGVMGGALKTGALAAAAAVGYLGVSAFKSGIEMTGSFDKAQASFTALTGSVDDGKKLLDDVKDFAFKTPFDVKQIADQTRNLLAQGQAYGVTKDNVLQYATAIGDAVALTGGGEIEFQRVTRALGQMGSSSKVMAQDMNQLQQSIPGINVWKELGEGLGVTEAEARSMGEAGLIPGAQAANILTQAMREMPGAAGEMERQASTVTGALQNFKEQATATLTEGMRPFTDALRTFLTDSGAKEAIAQLGGGFGQLLAAMAPVFPVITQLASTFGAFMGTLATALTPFLNILGPALTTMIAGLEGPLSIVAQTFGMLLEAVAPILPIIAQLVVIGAELIGTVLQALQPAIKAVGDAFGQMMDVLGPVIADLGDELGPIFKEVATAVGRIVIALVPFIPLVSKMAMAFLPIISEVLPVFADLLIVIADALVQLLPAFLPLVTAMTNITVAVTGMLAKLAGGVVGALSWIIGGLVNIAAGILGFFANLVSSILSFLGIASPSKVFMDIGMALIQGLWDGIQALIGMVWDFFTTFPGKIIGFLASLGSMLFNLAGDAIRFLWNGFTSYIGLVWGFWSSLPGRVISLVSGLLGLIAKFGKDVLTGLWNGIESMWGFLSNNIGGLPARIVGAIGNLASTLVQKGKDLIQGLWNGISSIDILGKVGELVRGVTSKLGDIASKINPFDNGGRGSLRAASLTAEPNFASALASGFSGYTVVGDMNPTAMPVSNARSAGGITFNGPVTFGSDASSSVAELDWMRRTRMGAA
jgi:tape measure domain-containing protein